MQEKLLRRLDSTTGGDPAVRAQIRETILQGNVLFVPGPMPTSQDGDADTEDHPEPAPSEPAVPETMLSQLTLAPETLDESFRQTRAAARQRHWEQSRLPPEPILEYLVPAPELLKMCQEAEDHISRFRSENQFSTVTFYTGDTKACSRACIKELTFIDVIDMQVRQVHKGRSTLLRTVTLPDLRAGFTVAAVSPAGVAVVLQVNHWPLRPLSSGRLPTQEEYRAAFPIGTIVVIKEPHARLPLQGDMATIRVDSPTDMFKVVPGFPGLDGLRWRGAWMTGESDWQPQVPDINFEAIKTQANDLFEQGEYPRAESLYSLGLLLHPQHADVHLLLLNRCAARLRLLKYYPALEDAEAAILELKARIGGHQADSSSLLGFFRKAAYREGCALYGLRVWQSARDVFQLIEDYEDASQRLEACKKRLKEAERGEYDLYSLFTQSQKPRSRLEVADFVGPVRVGRSDERGRGLFASRPIKAGELLLVNKCLSVAYLSELAPHIEYLSLDIETGRADCSALVALRYALLYELAACNPIAARQLEEIHIGTDASRPSLEADILLTPPTTRQSLAALADKPVFADCKLVDEVTTFSSFSPTQVEEHVPDALVNKDKTKLKPKTKTTGVKEMPFAVLTSGALFNHSCWPNADYTSMGDVVFFRALRDIAQGEELLVSYCGAQGFDVRKLILKSFFIDCKCKRCLLDQKDGDRAVKKRADVLDAGHGVAATNPSPTTRQLDEWLDKREAWAKAVISTFSKDRLKVDKQPSLTPELFQVWTSLASLAGKFALENRSSIRARQAIRWYELALESCGAVLTKKRTGLVSGPIFFQQQAAAAAANVAACYDVIGESAKAEGWMRAARDIHSCYMGDDRRLFEHRFSISPPWQKIIERI